MTIEDERRPTPGPWTVDEPVGMQKPRIHGADGTLVAEDGNVENTLEDLSRHEADEALIVRAVTAHQVLVAALTRIINANRQHRGMTSEDAHDAPGPCAREALSALGYV